MTNSFPNIFKELIERNNTTIKAVADYAGVTRQAVSQYANGNTQPNADVIIKIAEYFEVTTDYLLGVTPSQKGRKTMTVEQAIKELNEQKAALDKYIARGGEFGKKYSEALGMAIDLMEREIPRAVVDYDPKPESDIKGYCPKCGEPFWDKNGDRCGACNQAISWRLTECIYNGCEICGRRLLCDDRVCEHYADKVDEIRRIHDNA